MNELVPEGEFKIPADAVTGTGFSPKELVLIELLADVGDKRPKDQKSEAAGFHKKRVYDLQHNPKFNNAVYARMREALVAALPTVYASLLGVIQTKKDLKAIELLLRAAGEIQQGGGNQQINTTVVRADTELRRELVRKSDEELKEILRQETEGCRSLLEPTKEVVAKPSNAPPPAPGVNRLKLKSPDEKETP